MVPANAAVVSHIYTPFDGQRYALGQSAEIVGACEQNGVNAFVESCTVRVTNPSGTQIANYNVPVGFKVNDVPFSLPLPTDSPGDNFGIVVTTVGTGTGIDIATILYSVNAGAPSVTINAPSPGTAVNPGAGLNLSSTCSPGAGGNLTACFAAITHPDGSVTNASANGALPTSVSGDYGVHVTANQSDGQSATEYTWYRVNTPIRAQINNPVQGGVVNQGDSSPFNGGCIPGTGSITRCELTFIDPNGNVASQPAPNRIPTGIRGIYTVKLYAEDSNGLSDYEEVTYRVNAYPTVDITSPLNGLRVYTDTEVPALFSCADAEGPVASCVAPVGLGGNVDTSPAGPKSFKVVATDSDGAKTEKTVAYQVFDRPTVAINGPAVDTVVNPGDTAPVFLGGCAGGVPEVICTMEVTGPDGTTQTIQSGDSLPTNAFGTGTIRLHVIDDFGTVDTETRTYKVNEPPHVTFLNPVNGSTFFQGQDVTPTFGCYDDDNDGSLTEDFIVSCTGTPGPLATQTTPVGVKTFTVTTVDNDGATSTESVTYKVVPVVGSCQGTGLMLLDNAFGQTKPADPCKTGESVAAKVNAPLGSAAPSLLLTTGVKANAIEGYTTRTQPATFSARADVADATVNILGTVNLKVTGVHSTATSKLLSCSAAQLTGTSTVGTLVLNGVPIVVGTTPLSIPLGVGSLHLNQRVTTATGITMRSVFLDLPGTALDVVIGESSVAPRCGTI